MAALNVRNLSAETHRARRVRAAAHGRSTEAEVRAILDEAVRADQPIKLGTFLAAIGAEFGGADLDFERDGSPPEPAIFD
jgi:plasmid stability protein